MLDDESPTSANLENDHRFMSEEYQLHRYEAFWESPKRGQYHTIVESRIRLKNL